MDAAAHRPGSFPMNIGRLFRTVRHLRATQVWHRLRQRLPHPGLRADRLPSLAVSPADFVSPAARLPSMVAADRANFLNKDGPIGSDWDPAGFSKLWRYNLHYFDDLNAAGAGERTAWHRALVGRWLAGNPPTMGTGWEPYPTSLRIVNWIKWHLREAMLDEEAMASLALQTRWLAGRIEWHILGNHLFANAKALLFAGLMFEGDEAATWRRTASAILRRELPEQCLPDGGHFELSPMYHLLFLEDALDIVNIVESAKRAGRADDVADIAGEIDARLPAMFDWARTMGHPDGEIAFFNDAAFDIAPTLGELTAYAGRLGRHVGGGQTGSRLLASSGYARLERGGATVIADVARAGPDYLPGHAHADTLGFELSRAGRRIIVNGGTSLYEPGAERLRQRGTAAHSTLVLDDENSSEIWSSFRVGRRAYPRDVTLDVGEIVRLAGEHDGYRHLAGRPVHKRIWSLAEDHLEIADRISSARSHRADIRFHLGSGLTAHAQEASLVEIRCGASGRTLAELSSLSEGAVRIEADTHHPRFGIIEPTEMIVISYDSASIPDHRTRIGWPAA
jgi:uncharacterized heparinase superfamily protein